MPPRIPQELLARLFALREALREIRREDDRIRGRILELSGAGATSEPGPFVLDIRETTRPFTIRDLVALLGKEEVERLRGLVEARTRLTVRVRKVRRRDPHDLKASG